MLDIKMFNEDLKIEDDIKHDKNFLNLNEVVKSESNVKTETGMNMVGSHERNELCALNGIGKENSLSMMNLMNQKQQMSSIPNDKGITGDMDSVENMSQGVGDSVRLKIYVNPASYIENTFSSTGQKHDSSLFFTINTKPSENGASERLKNNFSETQNDNDIESRLVLLPKRSSSRISQQDHLSGECSEFFSKDCDINMKQIFCEPGINNDQSKIVTVQRETNSPNIVTPATNNEEIVEKQVSDTHYHWHNNYGNFNDNFNCGIPQIYSRKCFDTKSKRKNSVFCINTYTWVGNSHGLYDYESKNLYHKTFYLSCRNDVYKVLRHDINVVVLSDKLADEFIKKHPKSVILMKFMSHDDYFYMIPSTSTCDSKPCNPKSSSTCDEESDVYCNVCDDSQQNCQNSENLWLVTKSLKEKGYRLSVGDVVKLGRFQLKVKEIVATQQEAYIASSRRFISYDDDDCETVVPETDYQGRRLSSQMTFNKDVRDICRAESKNQNIVVGNSNSQFLINSGSGLNGNDEIPCQQSCVALNSVNASSDILKVNSDDGGVVHKMHDLDFSPLDVSPKFLDIPVPDPCDDNLLNSGDESSKISGSCRICLSALEEPNNPLISPCKCRGSMRFVHLQCIRTWMQGRLNIKNYGSSLCFFWKLLDCELCKTQYPTFVSSGESEIVELLQIPRPNYPYILLEPKSEIPSTPRGFYIVNLSNNKRFAKMGRNNESDIRLSDISVSRSHALLKFNFSKNYFYIEDHDSKFGTLVELKEPYKLEYGISNLCVQSGRTLLSLSIKKNRKLLPSCFNFSGSVDDDISTSDHSHLHLGKIHSSGNFSHKKVSTPVHHACSNVSNNNRSYRDNFSANVGSNGNHD